MAKREVPQYQQIAAEVEKAIQDGRYDPGDELPSINAYATEHGRSRSAVDRAYKSLADRGIIVGMQGKGFYVTPREPKPEESSDLRVFWSYAHKDDERTRGAITRLRESIQAEYELQTGNDANMFQDTKDIAWGMDWRRAIDESLGVTTFFVPILTPTYLRSPHCLAELRTAKERFEELGCPEGIYPIEFVDCSKAIELLADDSLATLLQDRQRLRSWIDLRLEDPSTSKYGKGVSEIVADMIEQEKHWEEATGVLWVDADGPTDYADEDGPLERIANIEEAMESLTAATRLIGEDIARVGEVFANEQMPENAGPRQALALAGRIAERLDPTSRQLEEHCKDYDDCMRTIDKGIDGLLEFRRIVSDDGDSDAADIAMHHESIEGLMRMTSKSFDQIESMRTTLRNFSRIARVLRFPCQRIDASIDQIVSSRHIIESWESKLRLAL